MNVMNNNNNPTKVIDLTWKPSTPVYIELLDDSSDDEQEESTCCSSSIARYSTTGGDLVSLPTQVTAESSSLSSDKEEESDRKIANNIIKEVTITDHSKTPLVRNTKSRSALFLESQLIDAGIISSVSFDDQDGDISPSPPASVHDFSLNEEDTVGTIETTATATTDDDEYTADSHPTNRRADSYGLPPVLIELACLQRSQPAPIRANQRWNWDYIESKASSELTSFIAERKMHKSWTSNISRNILGKLAHKYKAYCKKLEEYPQGYGTDEDNADKCDSTKSSLTESTSSFATSPKLTIPEYVCEDLDENIAEEVADDYGLSPLLIELAQVMESQPPEERSTRRKWDWAYIRKHASPRLNTYITEKMQTPSFKHKISDSMVGRQVFPAFSAYRETLRMHFYGVSDIIVESPEPEPKRRRKTTYDDSEYSSDESKENNSNGATTNTRTSNNSRRNSSLSAELCELAQLVSQAKKQGKTWTFVEVHASRKLTLLIKAKASEGRDDFFSSPLDVLIPAASSKAFYRAVEIASTTKTTTSKESFALQRRSALNSLLTNLSAGLIQFEAEEKMLWDSVLCA